jgi:hypothetical protein
MWAQMQQSHLCDAGHRPVARCVRQGEAQIAADVAHGIG